MRLARAIVLVASLAGAMVVSRPAFADNTEANARARALELSKKSRDAYRERRFEEAVSMLLEARALTREPILLYNLGRAYEGLGDLERALAVYEEYLQEAPRAPDRETTERRVEALKREIAERKAAPPPASAPSPVAPAPAAAQPAAAPPPPPPVGRKPSVVPIVVAGSGLATLAAGGVFGLLTNSAHDAAVANPTGPGATSDQDSAETFAVVANVCFVAGGILTAAGITWTIVDRSGAGKSSAALRLTPLGAMGTF